MLKTTKFWLILSLCLNLIFLGVLAGGAFRAHKVNNRMGPPPNEMTAIMRSLPQEGRRAMMDDLRQQERPDKRADIDQLAGLIDAEPFEPDAVQAYFDTNRRRNDERVQNAQAALLDSLTKASDVERDEIAQNLRDMPKRPKPMGLKRRDDDHNGRSSKEQN